MKISKEEVLKIAHISRLALDNNEIDLILQQLQDVLEYAQCVQKLADETIDLSLYKNSNVTRAGVVTSSHPEVLLSRAPEREDHYFVVPCILDTK